ncbi:YbgA family protein [Halobacillus mangrovi]|uniref:YbgA family protein n=1 Tax=Halobacillus mangrovi TaxID=402384 RepID=UPI003D966037
MNDFPVPRVVVSRCLEFGEVRYNGAVIPDKAVQRMRPYVEFIPICPEVEIGLGVPRDVIRIVEGEEKQLIQPKTGEDLTEEMKNFSKGFLSQLSDVDGFLLKNRSPTCGMHDVKVYQSEKNSQVVGKTSGLFANEILQQFGGLAIEEEGRLKNFTLRHHFLTKLFTLASFRQVKKQGRLQNLQAFHSRNKYLFMAYHPGILKQMGRIIANHDNHLFSEVIEYYKERLYKLLGKPAKPSAHVNVCQHMAGYFKKELSPKEKEGFQSLLKQYSDEKVPLSAVLSVLHSWVDRFDNSYLQRQTYFEPYPLELVEISDSGKGRAYS